MAAILEYDTSLLVMVISPAVVWSFLSLLLPAVIKLPLQAEGTTLITTLDLAAAHGHEYTYASRMITLEIHSSLEAVGFMAAISKGLTERGCSANVVSAFFHDHLFVPVGMEGVAMEVLGGLKEGAGGEK
ncbi:hypothetical protein VF21_00522 [Pseudogymnoascus sp. 05NY08]|nr:hypothetical protein VF21_00522 [Pseudogymnoascus sp. 05NY08]